MAEIRLTISGPDEVIAPSLDAFCKQHGWQETVTEKGEDVPNPVDRLAFARGVVRRFFIDAVRAYNVALAQEQARHAAASATDAAIDRTSLTADLA